MKPWCEIAVPHEDVLEGTFEQSQFAVDMGAVRYGNAPMVYLDPVLAAVKAKSEAIRQLAYRLYTLCERRGWADDARGYNDLVTAWPAIETVANAVPVTDDQLKMFGEVR